MARPSPIKHGTQNMQSGRHQWLSGRFRVYRIRFRPGLSPGPHWGNLQRSRDNVAVITGPTIQGEGEREREVEGKRKGKGRGGTSTLRKFPDPRLF